MTLRGIDVRPHPTPLHAIMRHHDQQNLKRRESQRTEDGNASRNQIVARGEVDGINKRGEPSLMTGQNTAQHRVP